MATDNTIDELSINGTTFYARSFIVPFPDGTQVIRATVSTGFNTPLGVDFSVPEYRFEMAYKGIDINTAKVPFYKSIKEFMEDAAWDQNVKVINILPSVSTP